MCESVGEQNVMSGEDGVLCCWCGMRVCCVVSLSMYMLSSCVAMSRPRRLLWLCSYQAVFLALKSPTRMALGVCVSGRSWGPYYAGMAWEVSGGM